MIFLRRVAETPLQAVAAFGETARFRWINLRIAGVHVVQILDYKPDARTNKPIAQHAIEAPALTRLVPGLKLLDTTCAWFDEQENCRLSSWTLFVMVSHRPSKPLIQHE